jgi:hypothetical protein
VAALIFLAPAVSLVCGYALLIVFAIAVMVHFLRGEYDAGAPIVYGMAVIVCLIRRNDGPAESPHDR